MISNRFHESTFQLFSSLMYARSSSVRLVSFPFAAAVAALVALKLTPWGWHVLPYATGWPSCHTFSLGPGHTAPLDAWSVCHSSAVVFTAHVQDQSSFVYRVALILSAPQICWGTRKF